MGNGSFEFLLSKYSRIRRMRNYLNELTRSQRAVSTRDDEELE